VKKTYSLGTYSCQAIRNQIKYGIRYYGVSSCCVEYISQLVYIQKTQKHKLKHCYYYYYYYYVTVIDNCLQLFSTAAKLFTSPPITLVSQITTKEDIITLNFITVLY